jgi:phthalate 4,5-cis-dihydrodiol dehydrogenase
MPIERKGPIRTSMLSSQQLNGAAPVRIGFIGLGMGASQILPQVESLPQFELVAGADVNTSVLARFQARYPQATTYETAQALCADPNVDAVWVATPNHFHAPYAILAAEHGKHVVSEKPMATSLADAEQMVQAAERNGVKLLCGHTLGFSPAVRAMRRIIQSGRLGAVRSINVLAYMDWMLAPRTPEEVDFSLGGGVIYRQTPHQLDTVRILAGGRVTRVSGMVGQWASERPHAPGFYSAYFRFDNDVVATITYNGYGYFMSYELVPWADERGGVTRATHAERAEIRRGLRDGTRNEGQLKDAHRVGGTEENRRPRQAEETWVPGHLGVLLVSCERGDIRHSAHGLYVYDDSGRHDEPIPEGSYRPGEVDLLELYEAIRRGQPVYHDGYWGMATLELIQAILQSSREGREVDVSHQVLMKERGS